MIYGSSRVVRIISSNIAGASQGVTGNTGSTGSIGPTGPQGATGSIGSVGFGLSGFTGSGTQVIFYGAQVTFTFDNVRGATGLSANIETPVFRVQNLGVQTQTSTNLKSAYIHNEPLPREYQPFSSGTDETVYFKTLTIQGNSQVQIPNFVGISSNSSVVFLYGATLEDNQQPIGNTGELMYIDENAGFGAGTLKAAAAPNTKYVPSENQLIIDQTFSREAIFGNKNWSVSGVKGFQYNNLVGNFSYYGGMSGNSFGTSTVQNTFIPQFKYDTSTDSYIPEAGDEYSGFTLAQSIIIGITSGVTFERVSFLAASGISQNNKFSPQNLTRDKIGSCCFCKNSVTDRVCIDYVSQDYCNAISGIFNTESCVNRVTGSECFSDGACCVYDENEQRTKCINTTAFKCQEFGGIFNESKTCANVAVGGEIFTCPTNFCTTTETGKCCVSGKCYNLNRVDCESISGSVFFAGQTCESQDGDSDCCSLTSVLGACCVGGNCTDGVTPKACNGIFQGIGTSCREVNCCGYSFSDDYFKGACADSCKALGAQQVYSCLKPGDKLGGGYFVGFVGMPNPCSSFNYPNLAYGEPLECLINPRGDIGIQTWRCKTCKGISGSDNTGSIEYFARTYPNTLPKNALDSRCMLKAGVPFVQQAYALDGITWPSEILFEGGVGYSVYRGTHSYSLVGSGLAVEHLTNTDSIYKYLASKIYGDNDIHILWALIIAPEDIEVSTSPAGNTGGSRLLSWGMMQGAHKADSSGRPLDIVIEEVPTYPVDGFLSTRIHDGSSRTNPDIWFRGVSGTTFDQNAYKRFSFGNGPAWRTNVRESEITTNKTKFKDAYTEMWNDSNPLTSAIRQITDINGSGYYGHNDWYIPSITELNYIYYNLPELNASLALEGSQIIGGTEYWSSTSVSRLKSWSRISPLDKDTYQLETIDSRMEPYLVDNRLTSQSGSVYPYGVLNPDDAYKFTMAVSNGQKMLTQVFNTSDGTIKGMIRSRQRNARVANLRPVRRIPLVVTCKNFYHNSNILYNYWKSGSTGCASCLDAIERMCN